MFNLIKKLYKPPRPIVPKPDHLINKAYEKYRFQVMNSIFWGYACYYLVRKNFSIAKPYLMTQLDLSKSEIGLIASGLSVAYGISKFIMGNISDRSNSRYFMATGLVFPGIINLFFGYLHGMTSMLIVWTLNGWFQGMGWPPCGRVLTHWFSTNERGTKFAIWNVAHNIGGGLAGPLCGLGMDYFFHSWQSCFYFPGAISIFFGILIIIFLRDTPQSVGLPPIEDYRNDHSASEIKDKEKELSAKEIMFSHVLNNRNLWILAFANCFVYVVRYGVLDWAPTYLTEVKQYNPSASRWQYFLYEYAGIPGTLLCGWLSDKFFKGRRSPITVVYMLLVVISVVIYWKNPVGNYLTDSLSLLAIGFLIYGPVMMIGVSAVDMVPKKAAGTAAGFTGFFGYFAGATMAELGIGLIVDQFGWNGGFQFIIISCLLAALLMALTWNVKVQKE